MKPLPYLFELQTKLFSITRFGSRDESIGEDIAFYSYDEFGQYLANQFKVNTDTLPAFRFSNILPLEIVQAPLIVNIDTEGYKNILEDIIDVGLNYEYTYYIYSTVNHTLDNPKLILLLPFDKDITRVNYDIVVGNLIELLDFRLIDNDTLPSKIGVEDSLGINKDSLGYNKLIQAPFTPNDNYKPLIISEIREKVLSLNYFLTPISDGLKKVN